MTQKLSKNSDRRKLDMLDAFTQLGPYL